MKNRVAMVFMLVLFPWLALSVACSSAPDHGAADDTRPADSAAGDGLAGTSWRLVRILAMDDRIHAPDDRAKYTLAFTADGRVDLRADCNRGQGSWSEPAPGQLRFGRLVTTRVMCPPRSWSNRFIRGLGDVRSYRLRGGRLYLSLMADGGIYEFEPMPR
ncbi:MAG: META domain-containing protein [Candidatus Competibacteraceae bacterium]|nr:META domain-containing protein [Candidatus Competibacteraceae bacterium]